MKKLSQHDLIMDYLMQFGSITPFEAFTDLGITKLATRVSEMKRIGIRFKTEKVESKNRFGKTVKFAKYSLDRE